MSAGLVQAIREAADPTVLMRRVAEQAMRLTPKADGASLEIRLDEQTLEYVAAVGTLEPFNGLRLNVHTSLSGLCALTGVIVRTDDARNDPRSDSGAVQRTGVVSMLAVPLRSGANRAAVLKVTSRQRAAFTPSDDGVLVSLADFVRSALDLAHELARVTTALLASTSDDTARLQTARFVAEVMRPGLVDDIRDHQEIRDVLGRARMEVALQPIADMTSGQIRMVEALSRFVAEPQRPPDVWFAQAHRLGLGEELECAAVSNALAKLPIVPAGVDLCINVSPHVLISSDLLALIDARVRHRIILEITEHEAIEPVAMAGALADLRAAGVRVAIDDTGSGYASLSSLLRIAPDIIKLDRDLVRGIDHDPVRRALAKALVNFANEDLASTVVAEGIETEAEASALVDLGIHLGQGYFLGRPGSPADISWDPKWHRRRGLPIVP